MQTSNHSGIHAASAHRVRPRTALVASADCSFRQRVAQILTGLRWQVREVEGGAQAWAEAGMRSLEAVIVDSWLPDLELNEFMKDFRVAFSPGGYGGGGWNCSPAWRARADPIGRNCSTRCAAARTGAPRMGLHPRGGRLRGPADGFSSVSRKDADTAVWNAAPVLTRADSPAPAAIARHAGQTSVAGLPPVIDTPERPAIP